MHSAAGLIDRAIKLIHSESKAAESNYLYYRGKFKSVKRFLDFEYVYEKALVLYGINAIYKKNLKN